MLENIFPYQSNPPIYTFFFFFFIYIYISSSREKKNFTCIYSKNDAHNIRNYKLFLKTIRKALPYEGLFLYS
jgi:hypothetical protein